MNHPEGLTLLSNASADGTGQIVRVGGRYIWALEATFSGGSWKLQAKNANGTYTDIPGASMSANGFIELQIAPNATIKAVKSGSPTAAYSTLVRVTA